jgi:hypothetical protein
MEYDQWELAISKSDHRTILSNQVHPIDESMTAKTLLGKRGKLQSVETELPALFHEQDEVKEEVSAEDDLNMQLGLTFVNRSKARFSLILEQLI